MKFKLFLLSTLAYCLSLQAQQERYKTFISDSLDNYIEKGMKDWKIPGLSVAIVKDDQVVFIKGFGVTDYKSNQPVDENTLFMIGSNTKAFTATALSMLQEAGMMRLDDNVQKWMPEFQLKDPLASREATIVDLLSHRIGFDTFQGDFTYWSSNLTRAEIIQKMSLIDAPYSFRTTWGYCNAGYVAAGEIIPKVTGNSWGKMIKDSIIIPLGMNRTLLLSTAFKNAKNLAQPHTIVNNELVETPPANIDNLAAAGSMSSSAKDMTKWLQAQLNDGKINDKQVLSAQSLWNIRQPQSIISVDSRDNQKTHFYLYGMGLEINDRNNKLVYSHTGGINGFLSSVLFIPEENLGIVVLTNTDQNYFFQNLVHEIRDAYLGLPFQDYSGKSLGIYTSGKERENARMDSLKSVVRQHHKPTLQLENYIGTYTNTLYGDIDIQLDKNTLVIDFSNHPNLTATLQHIKDDRFLCTFSDAIFGIVEVPFVVDNGRVQQFTLKVADYIERTPYKFVKKTK